MKPRFALDLSNESVALLERSGSRWTMIAKLALDAPDLLVDLGRLQALMEARAPGGYCTKLILPNSQILYLELEAPGPDRQSRRAQIAAALKGCTPYAVSDLVFDWSQSGTLAKVAVVARETLDEADAFAEENGFCPVAFVAVPEAGRFGGEPYFGLTAGATDHIGLDERLDRDQDPVMITGVALAELPPAAEPAETPPPQTVVMNAQAAVAPDEPTADAQEPISALAEPDAGAPAGDSGDIPAPVANADGAKDSPAASETPAADPIVAAPEDLPEAAPLDVGQAEDAKTDPTPEAPFIAVDEETPAEPPPAVNDKETADTEAEPDVTAILQKIRSSVTQSQIGAPAVSLSDSILAAPTGFQSRRQAGASGTEGERLAKIAPRLGAVVPGTDAARHSAARATTLSVAAPKPPGSSTGASVQMARAQAAIERVSALGRAGLKDLQQRAGSAPWDRRKKSGVSSAKKPSSAPTTRMVMAILIGAVAVFLGLAVLLWSLFVGTAPAPETIGASSAVSNTAAQTAEPPEVAPAPAAETATASPPDATATPTDPVPATATADIALSPAPAVPVTAPATLAAPESDPAASVATASEPAATEAALASSSLDQSRQATDSALGPQPLPLPKDQMPVLGADGLIMPTVAGVLTPGGYTLYAGKPALVPPARPVRPATGPDATPTPENDPLFAVKPRPRPPGFVPVTAPPAAPPEAAPPLDNGALTPTDAVTDVGMAALPPADPKLATLKPKARPAAVVRAAAAARQNLDLVANAAVDAALAEAQAQEAALTNPTAQAVSRSDLPQRRPKALVARVAALAAAAPPEASAADTSAVDAALAEANQPVATEPTPTDTAAADQPLDEPEPTDGVPTMPTTKTVAKKSTLANALNLGNINLIGVYGSSAHRRALVRTSSGRFIKVQIGDALDGGQVAAIGDNELAYVKGGQTIVLRMVKGG